jgi:hypothetical protein
MRKWSDAKEAKAKSSCVEGSFRIAARAIGRPKG